MMSGVSGINGLGGANVLSPQPANLSAGQNQVAGLEAQSTQIFSLDSSQISSNITAVTQTGVATIANNDLLGAVLLLLMLEYMKSTDDKEKKGLLALMGTLAQLQHSSGSGSLLYASSSLSIESTQLQMASLDSGINAYSGTTALLQQAPGVDAAAGGLNITA